MGANQSSQQEQPQSSDSSQQGGIHVVNPTPGSKQTESTIVLPQRVPPVLSIEGHLIDPNRHKPKHHQLNDQLWIDFALILNEFSSSRSELLATRQAQLQDKIGQVDDHVQRFADSYVNCKHKALAKMNDDSRKVADIDKLLQKCTIQSELCVSMLNKLNFLLPDDQKLELLEAS